MRFLFLVMWVAIARVADAQDDNLIQYEATVIEIDHEYSSEFSRGDGDDIAPLVTLEVYSPEERKGSRVRILLDAPMHPNFSAALGPALGRRLILPLHPEQLESPQQILLSSEMDKEIVIITSGSRY